MCGDGFVTILRLYLKPHPCLNLIINPPHPPSGCREERIPDGRRIPPDGEAQFRHHEGGVGEEILPSFRPRPKVSGGVTADEKKK